MLSTAAITALFRTQESDRVERKASINDGQKIKEAICAFANDYPRHGEPGVIFIGQHDDRSWAKLRIDARLLETLGGWRSEGSILPFPSMTVNHVNIDGCDVAVIQVEPSERPPVRFNGRTWIRVGPRRAVATAAEENRLSEHQQWLNVPADAKPIQGATLDDLDLTRFALEYLPVAFAPEILAENGRSIQEQLRAVRFIDQDDRPNATALLSVGIDPTVWLQGAFIQFLAVDGQDLSDAVRDQKRLTGTIGDQLRQADELIDLLITTPITVGSVRSEYPSYPASAIKQTVRNALLHRDYINSNSPVRFTWYSDRVEISSPGGLFGGVTPQNFGRPGVADYRNPTLAEAMRTLGYAERFGLGLQIVRSSLEKNGNPVAEYSFDDHFVHATIRAKP